MLSNIGTIFFKLGLFLFSFFSQQSDKYRTKNDYKYKKRNSCAWDWNPRPQNGRYRRIHRAMVAPTQEQSYLFKIRRWWATTTALVVRLICRMFLGRMYPDRMYLGRMYLGRMYLGRMYLGWMYLGR